MNSILKSQKPKLIQRRRLLGASLLSGPLATLTACGGGGDDADELEASIRFINATSDIDFMDIRLDGFLAVAGLPARLNYTGYGYVYANKTYVEVLRSGVSSAPVAFTLSLEPNRHYSGVILGSLTSGLVLHALPEFEPAPAAGQAKIRLLNASNTGTALSVFITSPTDSVVPGNETFRAGAFNQLSAFSTLPSARYRIRVIRGDDPLDVVFDIDDIELASTQVATLILAPSPYTARLALGLFVQAGAGYLFLSR